MDGSAMSVQVLCSVGWGVARRGNVPSSCKHGTWRASNLYPSELRGPAGARARLWHTAGTSHSSSPVSRKLPRKLMARWRSCWVCLAIRLGGGRRRRLEKRAAVGAGKISHC